MEKLNFNVFIISLLTLFALPINSYSQGAQKANFFERFGLHRANKHIERNPNNIDEQYVRDKLQRVPSETADPVNMLKRYAYFRSSKYMDFDEQIKQANGNKRVLQLIERDVAIPLQKWDSLAIHNPKKLSKIRKRYPSMKPTIDYWNKTIQKALKKDDVSLAEENDKLRDSLKDVQALNKLKSEYESPELLKSVANTYAGFMDSIISVDGANKYSGYRLVFERTDDGRDLIISVTPSFEKNEKYFELGTYTEPKVDKVFKIFALATLEKIPFDSDLSGSVIGEADAYKLERGSGITYSIKSNLWQHIADTLTDKTIINLVPNQSINNKELAFLRAYNAKYIFEETLERDCFNHITAIDHYEENPSLKDKKGTYRNATIQIYVFEFFTRNREELLNDPDVIIDNNLTQKEIKMSKKF